MQITLTTEHHALTADVLLQEHAFQEEAEEVVVTAKHCATCNIDYVKEVCVVCAAGYWMLQRDPPSIGSSAASLPPPTSLTSSFSHPF